MWILLLLCALSVTCGGAGYIAGGWSGRHSSTTLPLNEALAIAGDDAADLERRRSALNRICAETVRSIRKLQDVRSRSPKLAADAAVHLDNITRELR